MISHITEWRENLPTKTDMKLEAKALGIKLKFEESCYMGHIAMCVEGKKKVVNDFFRNIWCSWAVK